jgi:plasmid stabilization system protein ParE
MAYQIIWTENAKEDLKTIYDYLVSEWSFKIAENFITECESKIDLITHFPEIGIKSEKYKSVYRILITKHNALYYLLEKDKITLLNFFDTRQNPDKNLF